MPIGVYPRKLKSPDEKLWAKVKFGSGDCWLWQGATIRGYGSLHALGESLAHRVAYLTVHGSIPAGHHVDHLCRQPLCVNPAHLEAVMPAVNYARARPHRVRRTHCPKGHEFTQENTRWFKHIEGHMNRVCKECERGRNRKVKG